MDMHVHDIDCLPMRDTTAYTPCTQVLGTARRGSGISNVQHAT